MGRTKGRANGDGDVFPRKNKAGKITSYRGAYFGPDGKRCWVSAKTKTECWQKLSAAMTDADRGILPSPANLTIESYLSSWLTDRITGTVSLATYDAYHRDVQHHIIPVLGRRKLRELSSSDVRRLYRLKRDEGLSDRTLLYIHTTLRRALKDAVNDPSTNLHRNSTDGVKPHKTLEGLPKSPRHSPSSGSCVALRGFWEPLRGSLHRRHIHGTQARRDPGLALG